MKLTSLPCLTFASALTVALLSSTTGASLILSFDQPTYSTGVGGTASVSVYLSQIAGGTQVSAANPLLTADIAVSFPTPSSADVLSNAAVTTGPAWDDGLATNSDSAGTTTFNISLLSLTGISNFSTPVLLATLHFTGITAGGTTVTASDFDPTSVDFITANANPVDPANLPSSLITTTVPEPTAVGSLVLPLALATGLRRRRA